MPLLQIENMHSYYGHIHAVRGISLAVEEGEVVTLIGSNGAGKTTTLRSIHGILPPREGKIVFDGEEIQGTPAHDMIRKGIAQSPEGRKIFHRMTVLENLEMGAYHRNDRSEIREDMDRVFDLFPRLKERIKQEAGTLSGGEQQMLTIGRALMSRRALDGPRTRARRAYLQDHPGDKQAGHYDLARRAERQCGPRDRHPRLRSRDGGDRQLRLR
jgi:branched-chain amino acid transport system ATP-binding protein